MKNPVWKRVSRERDPLEKKAGAFRLRSRGEEGKIGGGIPLRRFDLEGQYLVRLSEYSSLCQLRKGPGLSAG